MTHSDDHLIDEMSKEEVKRSFRMVVRPHLYVDGERWSEGYWFYRDEDGRIFSVPGFRPGISVAIVSFLDGFSLLGVAGERDRKERPHAQGGEVITTIDRMGDLSQPFRRRKRLA